jgi:nitrate reductase cytochrome c-type subunit
MKTMNPRTEPQAAHSYPAHPAFAVPPVIRSYALSVDAFDHLKAMQRDYERQEGATRINSQVLERMLNEHASQFHAS